MTEFLKSIDWLKLILAIAVIVLIVMNVKKPEPTDTTQYEQTIDSLKTELGGVQKNLLIEAEARKRSRDTIRMANEKLAEYEAREDSIINRIGNRPDYRVLSAYELDSAWSGFKPL